MHITGWKKDRRYGKRVFKLRKRQSLPKFTWSSIVWGSLGVLPQKIFMFFISQEHILSNFKHFLKQNSIKITVFFRFFRNNLISFLFPRGHQNILAISLSILFPCNFPCKCLNFLLQGNFLASGSPGLIWQVANLTYRPPGKIWSDLNCSQVRFWRPLGGGGGGDWTRIYLDTYLQISPFSRV